MAGAPTGNHNAARGAEWRSSIKRALARAAAKLGDGDQTGYRKGLDIVADKFIAASCDGEPWAMKELGDRIDGKPTQPISGPDGGPVDIDMKWTVEIVGHDADN